MMETLKKQLSFLSAEFIDELVVCSTIQDFSKGTQILRDEQYIKVLPIVLEGLVKVGSNFGEKELLLYYIKAKESCVMTFSAALKNIPSKVFAITEEDSKILLIPVKYLNKWLKEYPDFNQLFYNQYDLRYSELLDTIEHILVNKIDKRVFEYLKLKKEVTHQEYLKLTHGQIATEIATAREVVSRAIKKLETEGKLTQDSNGIKIMEW